MYSEQQDQTTPEYVRNPSSDPHSDPSVGSRIVPVGAGGEAPPGGLASGEKLPTVSSVEVAPSGSIPDSDMPSGGGVSGISSGGSGGSERPPSSDSEGFEEEPEEEASPEALKQIREQLANRIYTGRRRVRKLVHRLEKGRRPSYTSEQRVLLLDLWLRSALPASVGLMS